MERRKNNNRGLAVFICIALVVILGLGAALYLPKLLKHNDNPVDVNVPTNAADPAASGDVIVVTGAPSQAPNVTDSGNVGVKSNYAVSCSNPYATGIGMSVLENGGNAVDAAIAVCFALGVLEPYASGIGGGGGMLVYDPATNTSTFFDYRDASGADRSGTFGKTGVPGFVLGMETVYQKYGSKDWGSLIQPSVEYADNGFTISASFARHLQSSANKLKSKYQPQFYNGNLLLREGDTIVQHDLAETYRLIQRYGSTVFYHGAITEHMMAAVGGKLTQHDFDIYQVAERVPVQGTYKGSTIVSAPAPFSGATLIQMLEIAEKVELGNYEDDLLRYARLMGSISSVTLKDRLAKICDPAFHTVPDTLLAPDHIAELAANVASGNPEYLEPDPEHESTTHISVIDSNGMMVSVTNTLSDFFGYGAYCDGFFLNNTMKTSSDGVTARNYCVQGQRPRSFAMPTFIFGQDGSKVVLGSSGGDRIPQVVSQIILRYFSGEDIQEACDKPRLVMNGYLYWIEDSSVIDPQGVLSSNQFMRMSFSTREYFGAFNAVGVRADGTAFGASDQRRYGSIGVSEENDG